MKSAQRTFIEYKSLWLYMLVLQYLSNSVTEVLFLEPLGKIPLTYISLPLLPKAATIPELSYQRKSMCLPLTRAAHPSLQALAHLFIYRATSTGLKVGKAEECCHGAKDLVKI